MAQSIQWASATFLSRPPSLPLAYHWSLIKRVWHSTLGKVMLLTREAWALLWRLPEAVRCTG